MDEADKAAAKRFIPRGRPVVRRAILEQLGDRCAYPGCRESTYLEVAHIRAESAGGPRYDPDHPTGSGTANLIVLCSNHHRLIDAEPHRFSADLLSRWRSDALAMVQDQSNGSVSASLQQKLGSKASSLAEALKVWDTRTNDEPEEFWHNLFADVPELLALTIPGDTIQYGSKCYVGGKAVRNHGGNIVDFLYQSKSALNVTLVEIKRPSARLIGGRYRHMHVPSAELAGCVMQVLGYRDTLEKDYFSLARDPEERAMRVFNPKALVVIGDLSLECLTAEQRRSFELFRHGLKDVIILTFDQVFAKVRDIVTITAAEIDVRDTLNDRLV